EEDCLRGDQQHHAGHRAAGAADGLPVDELRPADHPAGHVFARGHRPASRPAPSGPAAPCGPADLAAALMARRRSRTGRSERISGRASKLCTGGGDVVAHSSVFPPHGSAGALRGLRSVMMMFTSPRSIDTAITYAEIVSMKFTSPHPELAGYVAIRRGIPHRPRKCIGKNVTLNEISRSQNCQKPSFLLSIRPLILGNQ